MLSRRACQTTPSAAFARAVVLAAGLIGLLGLTGCGDDDRIGDVEEAIATVLVERLGDAAGEVTVACPDDAALAAGDTLVCAVAVDSADAQEVTFLVGDDGTVELGTSVIPVAAAEDYLAGELAGVAETSVEVRCGDDPLLVGAVGDHFTCDAVRSDGASFEVTVEITGLDGAVRYEVETTSTVTSTPTSTATTLMPTDPATRPTVPPP